MIKIKKILCLLISTAVIAWSFYGCSSDNEKMDFIYPFGGDVTSFDPQVASTQDEFLIAENCFEGLIRIRDNGDIIPGVAESWSISSDGLTYTFNLRQGAKWRIKEDDAVTKLMGDDFNPDITAHDFVFALRRAADPNTQCPQFSLLSAIENADSVHSGKQSPDKLGVYAEGDYTLTIKLRSADDGFMSALTTAAAMPCNEEYFNATKGRYGLGEDYLLFNGQFYVSSVLESSYILRRNDLYTGDNPSKVTDITLNITNGDSDIAKRLKSGYYDCAYITGSEYESLNTDSVSVTPYSNKTWALLLNKNRQIFSNKDLRHAVCLSVSSPDTQSHAYLEPASGITPPSCTIGSQSATDAIGVTRESSDADKAVELWRRGLASERFTSASITVIATHNMEEAAKQLVQGIQGSIGKISSYGDDGTIAFSLKIEVLSDEEYDKAFSDGEYDIALHCFEASGSSAAAFLKSITDGNYIGSVTAAESAVSKAQTSSADNLAAACKAAEEAILEDYSLLPVFFESSYYAMANGVSGVDFHPGSGRVSFINAQREN